MEGWYVLILSFDSGLSCITPTHGFILVLEDILSDQILNCSLIMQSHQCISIIGKSSCMRCVTLGGHLLVRCDTCKHPATCPRWMSASFQDGWSSDRTKPQNVFLGTSLSHLWSILHSLKLQLYLSFIWWRYKTIVLNCLPPVWQNCQYTWWTH